MPVCDLPFKYNTTKGLVTNECPEIKNFMEYLEIVDSIDYRWSQIDLL